MLKSISVVAAVAVSLCFATMVYAAGHEARKAMRMTPRSPCLRCRRTFRSTRPGRFASLTASLCPPDLDISLKIDGTLRGSGFTGCNSWSATLYPVKDQHLAVGPYALTKKQCPKDVMQLELGFLSALLGSPAWDLVNGDLVIKGPRGALRLARSL